ncbi:MAG TPA: adenosylmethionine--8-amino-7-oxononanoate transaminase [Nitrospiraceae bacterium]|jgi:adenosylmethionine-8-amino-7-oxononanoate aminotransferase|nr:adenosylmethionine--8-amino-7-oxononanoate transaminase [Nitrospiraceae bacterium]
MARELPPDSKRLADWDRTFLWHPFTQMREWEQDVPLIIERGQGSYLIDTDGRRYLDGVSSIWVNVHGHRHPALDRALRRQLGKIAHSTMLGLSNRPAIELGRALIRLAPKGLTRVFYSDDGSTAVEVALKMALQYWQQRVPAVRSKRTFLHLQLGYHGDTVGAMSVGGVELFQGRFRPLLFRSYAAEAPYCYRCPLGLSYPTCTMRCIESVEAILKRRHQDIAALIIEPLVQAAAGMVIAPPGYLTKIRALCTQYHVLLIADEVATGFGRTGRMFACDHEGITPDLMAVSKGLTGGYLPLAATLTTDAVYQAFLGDYGEWKAFFHGHSYTGNPLACAVALANLDVFRRERTLNRMKDGIRLLRRLLRPLSEFKHVGEVRQCGYMVGLELVRDRSSRTPYPLEDRMGHRVAMEARRRGLLLRPLGNVVVLMPPLSMSLRDLRRMVAIVTVAIQTATES